MTSLTELEKLIAGATNGPWIADGGYEIEVYPESVSGLYLYDNGSGNEATKLNIIDAQLIALSRQALPNALRVIAECKRAIDAMTKKYGGMYDEWQDADKIAYAALALIAEFENNVEGE